MLHLPPGLTLAGLQGRAGNSWDSVSLLVCPWLPAGGWSTAAHARCLPPFKDQVGLLGVEK